MLGMRQPLICQVAKCASHGVQKYMFSGDLAFCKMF